MTRLAALIALLGFNIHTALAFDVCDMYLKRYHDNNYFVSSDLIALQDGRAELLILGQVRTLNVTVNGIDVNDTLDGVQEIICSGSRAGEIRFYNLQKLNLDAGYFEARVTGARGSDSAGGSYSLK